MSPSPDTPFQPNHAAQQRRLPPTPRQRRLGTQIGLSLILLTFLVVILLDHYHVIH